MPLSKKRDKERKRLLRLEIGTTIDYCHTCNRYGPVDTHHSDKDRSNNADNNLVRLCPNCHANIHRHFVQPDSNLNVKNRFQPKSDSLQSISSPMKDTGNTILPPVLDASGEIIPEYY